MTPLIASSSGKPRGPKDPVRDSNLLALYGACMKNAGDLLDDAELLLKHKSYGHAIFLGYSAYEEVAKAQIVADFYHRDLTESQFKKYFRHHFVKAAYLSRKVMLPQDLDAPWTMELNEVESKKRAALRESALYVDFEEGYKKRAPLDLFTKKKSSTLISQFRRAWRRKLEDDYEMEGIGARGHFK